MKMALLVGTALALSAGHAVADPALATSDVNMRGGPGTQYPVVGRIPGGSTVEAVNCTAGWCEAQFGGRSGYVNQSYLDFGGDAQPAPPVQVRPDLGGPPPGAIPVAPPGSYPPPPAGYYPPPADYAPPPPVYREPPPYGYPPPYDPPVYGPRYRDGAPPPPPPRNTQRPADGGRAQGAPQRQQQPRPQQQQQPSKQQQSAPPPAPATAPASQPPPQPAPAASPAPATAPPPKQDSAPHQGQGSGPPAQGKTPAPAQQPASASQAPNAPGDKK